MDLSEIASGQALRHPWETARAGFFTGELRKSGVLSRPLRTLDVGAGDAFVSETLLAELPSGSETVCWDTAYGPESRAPKGIVLTRERPQGKFDLILLLDVLEHVEGDRSLLSELVKDSLAPGGYVLVSVPAWPQLFTDHDVRLRHVRRYTPAEGRALVASAGLEIARGGGLFHGLVPVRAAQKALSKVGLSRRTPAAGDWRGGRLVTKALGAVLAADARVSSGLAARGLELPGLSWWALCRRR